MTIKVIVRGLLSAAFQVFLLAGWSNGLAAETSPMLTDPAINAAYKNCKLFAFDNKNDDVLSSEENHFDNLTETYGSQGVHDQCVVALKSKTLLPVSSSDANPGGEFVYIMIVRRAYLSPSYICEGRADYDECLEKAVFNYHGFHKDDRGKWKKRVGFVGDVNGNLIQSISETINGTIKNHDGITVISEWMHPYHLQDQTGDNMITLDVIRRTPFGYILAGRGYGVGVPVDQTQESKTRAIDIINKIINVVQSVRIKITSN
ncbi:hypothetical protein C7410_106131 [Paraburkholderia silvatlantica]|uniref:Uncharacterized protein n=1 Tax=Paraburkholderia silvatlantica TaxID=321895 RepID=A0A2V4TKD2_9BURK|nr:hypothetical protein [Paraburkholderia silvatlantica]PYE24301.1 hypothetical protein C7410_106131 [Paraburkholderia silvatlantica]